MTLYKKDVAITKFGIQSQMRVTTIAELNYRHKSFESLGCFMEVPALSTFTHSTSTNVIQSLSSGKGEGLKLDVLQKKQRPT